jgi:hypothetical protein
MGKIIGVIGSRARNGTEDYYAVYREVMRHYEPGDWLCSGACPKGGDAFAERVARREGIPILLFPPGTKHKGISKFFERNDLIAEHADILIVSPTLPFKIRQRGGSNYTCRKFLEKFTSKAEGNKHLFIV